MKLKILIPISILLITIASCKKEKDAYQAAQVYFGTDSYGNCGYLLGINNSLYAPTNLPQKYQTFSGVIGENIVFIQYQLLSDSLHCFDSLGSKRYDKTYRFLKINKTLE